MNPEEAEIRFEQKMKVKALKWSIATLLNVTIFFHAAFATLIPTIGVALFYLFVSAITFSVLKAKKNRRPLWKALGVAPLIVNGIFLLNYWISFNPRQEIFQFERKMQLAGGGKIRPTISWQASTEIILAGDAYKKYHGIRIFFFDDTIPEYSNKITYTIKTGILGVRVMTDYEFSREVK